MAEKTRTRIVIGKTTGLLSRSSLARLRMKAWVYPILAALVLGLVGLWALTVLERGFHGEVENKLQTILNADIEALRIWHETQMEAASLAAALPSVIESSEALARLWKDEATTADSVLASPPHAALETQLQPFLDSHGFGSFVLLDPSGLLLDTSVAALTGQRVSPTAHPFLPRVFAGENLVTPPFLLIKKEHGDTDDPVMFTVAGVRNGQDELLGTLAFRIDAREFTRILAVAQLGETGETYAFDEDGVVISHSRFEDALRKIGLLEAGQGAILNLNLRDPGGNMVEGFRPDAPTKSLPLTRMAASATAKEDGVDADGYPDYRGVQVVGAWAWLEDCGFGVATEVDAAEAYSTLTVLRTAFWAMIVLLVGAAVAIFVYSQRNLKLQQKVSEAKQLGQYTLGRKIGEGGMGQVFQAKHALLCRPTALKILPAEFADDVGIARFTREVQLTSQLTNPNTIAIYDYGQADDGTFYYAMEFLKGLPMDELLKEVGALHQGRVIHILKQVCLSLAEAHEVGLIHRDIKPANIMLCVRGGLYDMVKVLDFGLVKDVSGAPGGLEVTQVGAFAGTPLYVSPESIQTPQDIDSRSDLYSLGAVAYLMVSGRRPFDAESVPELFTKHCVEIPQPPSDALGAEVSPALERVIMACLEKSADMRPATARELYDLLDAIEDVEPWGNREAKEWWEARGIPEAKPAPLGELNDSPSSQEGETIEYA